MKNKFWLYVLGVLGTMVFLFLCIVGPTKEIQKERLLYEYKELKLDKFVEPDNSEFVFDITKRGYVSLTKTFIMKDKPEIVIQAINESLKGKGWYTVRYPGNMKVKLAKDQVAGRIIFRCYSKSNKILIIGLVYDE